MSLKFLDFETGLPYLWKQILSRLETHNTSAIAHQDIRDTISSLTSLVTNKVDKEDGKVLSSNDYTAAEKTKLAGIAAGATKVAVDSSLSSTSTNPVQNKIINAALEKKATTATTDTLQSSINTLNTKVTTTATSSALGMMSAADKTKLDGIATGATKIIVDTALSSSSINPVQNKVVYAALADKATTASVSTVSDNLSSFIAQKGAASGIAPLNSSSKIDSAYLPSYVDDVLEFTAKSNFPSIGETGKIYVDTSTNLTWRWGGSAYVEISPSIALGTTSSTAFRGDYGNAAYAHAVTNKGKAFSSGLYKITTNSEGHITAVSAVAKSDITALGIPAQDTTYTSLKNPYSLSVNGKSYNGSAAVDTGTIGLAYGGTGATTQSGAFTNIVASGGTITGPITAKGSLYIANNTDNAFLSFIPTNFGTNTMGRIFYYAVPSKTSSYFEFHQFSRSSSSYSHLGYADVFQLPTADADKTTFSYYKIITTKNLADADSRFVKKSGDTFTGAVTFKSDLTVKNSSQYLYINFVPNYGSGIYPGQIYFKTGATTTGLDTPRFFFRQWSPKSSGSTELTSYFEDYYLPTTENAKTSSGSYRIYTAKETSQIFNDLQIGQGAMPQDNDYFISQHVGGGTTNTTYYRHSISKLWTYINSKLGTSAVGSATQPVYWNGSKPVACGAISIANGGTGATNVINARNNLMYLGGNIISSTSDDTADNWAKGGLSVSYFSRVGTLVDQPSQWGYLLNVNNGEPEVHQIWMAQTSGSLYHRGGNTNGWQTSWKTILDSSNYTSYAATVSHTHSYLPLSGGRLTGALYTSNNLVTEGGFYVRNNATRPVIYFSPSDTNSTLMELAYLGGTSYNNLRIRLYSKKDGTVNKTDGNYYEEYQLPNCNADRTSNAYYSILTNKSAVTVGQGGTGATSAAGARANLGIYGTIVKSNQDANGNTISLTDTETFPTNMQYTFTAAGTYLIFASASISSNKTGVRAMRFYFYNSSGTNTKKMGEVRSVANGTNAFTIGLNSAIAVTVSANDVVKTLIYSSQTGLKLESYDFTVVRLL